MQLSTMLIAGVLLWHGLLAAFADSIPLPPRPPGAPTGTQFIQTIERMSPMDREAHLFNEIVQGNVPSWNTNFTEIQFSSVLNGSNYSLVVSVLPEYLAVGSDQDYFLAPMTPLLAQKLADRLGCVLPTRKIVNLTWTNSPVKLNPQPISPSDSMVTVPVFAAHNSLVRDQRNQHTNAHPLGALVSGHKKDIIISSKIYTNFATTTRKPVVIYGWHYLSGQPIQPAYNGHGESYVDYSHGVRLVNATARLNGNPVRIPDLLTNRQLAILISDEGSAEGTTNGVIALPRYTVAPAPPRVLEHPRSARIRPGEVLSVRAPVFGDAPLQWAWHRNGQPAFFTATHRLSVSNAQSSDSGFWQVIVSNSFGSATSRIANIRVTPAEYPILFSDDFESPSNRAWQVCWGASNGLQDHNSDFSFDHKYEGSMIEDTCRVIPPAPGSGPEETRAARFAVNVNDSLGSACAVNAFSRQQFSNDFAMSFDCWLNYPGGPGGINSTGSTQHVMLGMHHSGKIPAWIAAPTSDGLWFAASAEGGDQRDYRCYQGNPLSGPVELTGQSSGLVASNNSSSFLLGVFPASRFETPGAPGKEWVRMALHHSNNIVSWFCDEQLIARRTNNSGFTSGSIMAGLIDLFASIANPGRDSFLLVDNVVVEDLTRKTRILTAGMLSNRFRMLFSGIPGRQYSVESSDNLGAWEPKTLLTASNGPVEYTESSAHDRKFYRVSGPMN